MNKTNFIKRNKLAVDDKYTRGRNHYRTGSGDPLLQLTKRYIKKKSLKSFIKVETMVTFIIIPPEAFQYPLQLIFLPLHLLKYISTL